MKEKHLYVSGILLAAGLSTRMGGPNKLLAPFAGRPLVGHAAQVLQEAPVMERVVVLGHEAARVREVMGGRGWRFVENTAYRSGMTASIQAGVRHASPLADAYLILLGDMPEVTMAAVEAVLLAAAPGKIVVPAFQGRRGHPVLFGAQFREEILNHVDPEGCRGILQRHPEVVVVVPVEDAGVLRDIDTPEDLRAADLPQ